METKICILDYCKFTMYIVKDTLLYMYIVIDTIVFSSYVLYKSSVQYFSELNSRSESTDEDSLAVCSAQFEFIQLRLSL